jgi:hypothetical protein
MSSKVEPPEPMDEDEGYDKDDWIPRDKTAKEIIAYIEQKGNELINGRRKMDGIFLADVQPALDYGDLEDIDPKMFREFRLLEIHAKLCSDQFKQLVIRLNNEFGEGEWVKEHAQILAIPMETVTQLAAYKQRQTYVTNYQQLNQNQQLVRVYGDLPQTQEDYMKLSPGEQYNADADDAYYNQPKKNVFM